MAVTVLQRLNIVKQKSADQIAMCERACEIVAAIGFVNVGRSKKSEATYWQYPGRLGVLRIAAHKNTYQTYGDQFIAAALTFTNEFKDGGRFRLTHTSADNHLYLALGRYFVRSVQNK